MFKKINRFMKFYTNLYCNFQSLFPLFNFAASNKCIQYSVILSAEIDKIGLHSKDFYITSSRANVSSKKLVPVECSQNLNVQWLFTQTKAKNVFLSHYVCMALSDPKDRIFCKNH